MIPRVANYVRIRHIQLASGERSALARPHEVYLVEQKHQGRFSRGPKTEYDVKLEKY